MHVVFANLYWQPRWEKPGDVADFADGDEVRGPMARALAERGHTISIVQDAPVDADFADPEQPSVRWTLVRPEVATRALRTAAVAVGRPFPKAHARPSRFLAAVAEKAESAQALHGFDLVAWPTSIGLGRIATTRKIPLVLHFHGGRPPRGALVRVLAPGLANATVLFTTAEHARPFTKIGMLHPTQVLERNEMSTPFELAPERRPGLMGCPAILSIGRLDPVKDPLTTIAGFAAFLARVPEAHLHLAYADARMLAEVQKCCSTLGIQRSVAFHGTLPRPRIAELFASSDIFVQSSVREVGGTALFEALASGCAPVVSDIPSFRKVLSPPFTNHLFPPGDPAALAETLHRIWSNPPSRADIRAHFDATASWPALAAQLEALYATLGAGRAG